MTDKKISQRDVDRAVMNLPLKAPQKMLLIAISWYADWKTGWCNPDLPTLADDAGMARSSAKENLARIPTKFLTQTTGQRRADGRQDCNEYVLHIPEIMAHPPRPKSRRGKPTDRVRISTPPGPESDTAGSEIRTRTESGIRTVFPSEFPSGELLSENTSEAAAKRTEASAPETAAAAVPGPNVDVIDEGEQPWRSPVTPDTPEEQAIETESQLAEWLEKWSPRAPARVALEEQVQALEQAAQESDRAVERAPYGQATPPTDAEIEARAQLNRKNLQQQMEEMRQRIGYLPPSCQEIADRTIEHYRAAAQKILHEEAQKAADERVKASLRAAAAAAHEAAAAARQELETVMQVEPIARDKLREAERAREQTQLHEAEARRQAERERACKSLDRTCTDPVHRAVVDLYHEILWPVGMPLVPVWSKKLGELVDKHTLQEAAAGVAYLRSFFEGIADAGEWLQLQRKPLEWLLRNHDDVARGKYNTINSRSERIAWRNAKTFQDVKHTLSGTSPSPDSRVIDGEVVSGTAAPIRVRLMTVEEAEAREAARARGATLN